MRELLSHAHRAAGPFVHGALCVSALRARERSRAERNERGQSREREAIRRLRAGGEGTYMAPELITAKIPLITAACAGFKDLARTYPRTYARNSRSGGVSSVSLRSRREASFAPRARCTRIRPPFPPPPLSFPPATAKLPSYPGACTPPAARFFPGRAYPPDKGQKTLPLPSARCLSPAPPSPRALPGSDPGVVGEVKLP